MNYIVFKESRYLFKVDKKIYDLITAQFPFMLTYNVCDVCNSKINFLNEPYFGVYVPLKFPVRFAEQDEAIIETLNAREKQLKRNVREIIASVKANIYHKREFNLINQLCSEACLTLYLLQNKNFNIKLQLI